MCAFTTPTTAPIHAPEPAPQKYHRPPPTCPECLRAAPPGIAPQHSLQRGAIVAKALVSYGVLPSRIEVTAWGNRVGLANDWPASQEFARAEVYLAFKPAAQPEADGADDPPSFPLDRCMPSRPSCYDNLVPCHVRLESTLYSQTQPTDGSADEGVSSDDSDDDDMPAGGGGGLLAMLTQLQARLLLTALLALLTAWAVAARTPLPASLAAG